MSELSTPRRVVIVGAGLAGLSAAEALADVAPGRFAITLLEARRSAGGRAGSFVDRVSGESVDYCQHVTMGCCTELLGWLQRIGQLEQWTRYRQLTFLHPESPPSRFRPARWLPAPLHLGWALGRLGYLTRPQRRQISAALWRLMRTPSDALRNRRAGDWLRHAGQDESTIAAFWDVILVSALGESTDVVSMAAARMVLLDGFAAARGASDVLVPKQPLARLLGTEAIRSTERLGVKVRTQTRVRRVIASTTKDAAAWLETADGERVAADEVVLALPASSTARLIRDSQLEDWFPDAELYRCLPQSPITGVHLWLDREVMTVPHATLIGMMSQWIFRQPIETERRPAEHYYQVVISASHDVRSLEPATVVEQVMRDLHRVLPGAAEATVLRFKLVTDPHAVLSLRPEVDAIRPPAHTPLPWLHLAGDWIQTGWPATMEGAVISGRLAANSLLARAGLPALLPSRPLRRGWLARRWIVA